MELIRIAVREDLQDVLSLYRHLFPEEDYSTAESYAETWSQIISDPKISCFIAYTDSIPVATCIVSVIPNLTRNQRPYALIENVVTHRDYRNRGFGRRIMEKAVEHARKANCYKVMLLSASSRREAHRFYEKCGFDGSSKKGFQLRLA